MRAKLYGTRVGVIASIAVLSLLAALLPAVVGGAGAQATASWTRIADKGIERATWGWARTYPRSCAVTSR
jgi:hypothetical protein